MSCFIGCAGGGYVFGVSGQVREAGGKPLRGARVTLTTEATVYDAVTPLRSRTLDTDAVGWFAFQYTTHDLPTRYVLRVEKDGCRPQLVRSVAPPSQEHAIRLECDVSSP